MTTERDLIEFDPNKKDIKWATDIVTYLRMNMKYVVNPADAEKFMNILMGAQDMKNVKRVFADPEKANLEFIPLKIAEKLRNIMVAEVENAGVHITANCVDPSATNERKKDRDLLKHRALIEASVGSMQKSIGLPGYKMSEDKDEDGKPIFKGNVEKFDELGLNANNEDEMQHFWDVHYRLKHEIRAEIPANLFMKLNRVQRSLPLLCNDILAKKAIAMHVYVNELTGEIEIKRLAPETVKWVPGRELDGRDAQAKGYERNIPVSEFLEMVGSEFVWDRDWKDLLRAVNYGNKKEYTGVRFDANTVYGIGSAESICSYNTLARLSVTVGYIEFKTVNGTKFKVTDNDYHSNPKAIKVNWDAPISDQSKYDVKKGYKVIVMKATYLVYDNLTQKLYRYAPLAFQKREGANDEYACYSICVATDVGPSAMSVIEPFIIPLQKAFEKMIWMVNKALPEGRSFNYSALLKIAESMFDDTKANGTTPGIDPGTAVIKLMETFTTTGNELWEAVTNEQGVPIGGNAQPNSVIKNGLSQSVVEFQLFIDSMTKAINDYLGISPLAGGETLGERDGYKLQMQALQTSRKSTQYVTRMLNNMFEDVATRVLSYTQDIIRYKSLFPVAYNYMKQLLGDEGVEDLDEMGDIALHRYGTFMESFNGQYDLPMLRLDVEQAFANKEITIDQKILVLSVDSPKQAGMILSFQKEKARKQAVELQQQQSQNIIAQDKNRGEVEKEVVKMKNDGNLAVAQAQADGLRGQAQITGDASIKVAQMKIDAERSNIPVQTDADIAKEQAKAVPEMV